MSQVPPNRHAADRSRAIKRLAATIACACDKEPTSWALAAIAIAHADQLDRQDDDRVKAVIAGRSRDL
jgi:hypothetical protein